MKNRIIATLVFTSLPMLASAQLQVIVDSIYVNSKYSREDPCFYAPIITIEGAIINESDKPQLLSYSEHLESDYVNTYSGNILHFKLQYKNRETRLVYYRSECYPIYFKNKRTWYGHPKSIVEQKDSLIICQQIINPKDSFYFEVNGMILLEDEYSNFRELTFSNCQNPIRWHKCGRKMSRILKKIDLMKCKVTSSLMLEDFEPLVLD